MTGGRGLRPAGALLAVLALAGWAGECPRRAPAPATASAPCAPVQEGMLAAGARADALAGEYRLTLAATRGPRSGQSASGTLRLEAFGARPVPVPATAGTRYPLFGGTDVALADVGALALGDVRGADPARPGVLVMEWARTGAAPGNEITLRLGSEANQGGQQRFDGTYMALSVREMTADRFVGTWESGAGEPVAGGYFCAERVAR